MKNCPNCNAELPDDSKFCTSCGAGLGNHGSSEEQTENAGAGGATEAAGGENQTGEPSNEKDRAAEPTDSIDAALSGADTQKETLQRPESEEKAVNPPVPGEPKKKGAGKIIAGCVIAAAVIVIAVCAVMFGKKGSSAPEDVVFDAFRSVFADKSVRPIEELLGFGQLSKNSLKENTQTDFSLSVSNTPDPDLQILTDGGISMTSRNNVKDGVSDLDFSVRYGAMDLFDMTMYMDSKELMLSVPGLSDTVFTMDYANDLAGQIERSPFLGKMMTDGGINTEALTDYIDYVMKTSNSNDIFDISGLWKRYREQSKAIDNLKAAMTIQKTDKKTLQMDGGEEACQGYEAVVPKDALIEFVKTSSQFLLEDETFKANITEYFDQVFNLSYKLYGMSLYSQTGEEMQADAWEQIGNAVDELVKAMENGMDDVAMTVYVDKKGRMAALNAKTAVKVDDETTVDMTIDANFAGGAYLTQNMDATLTMSDGIDIITLTMAKDGVYDKDNLTSNVRLGASNGIESYEADYSGQYKIQTGEYDISLALLSDEINVLTLTSNGVVSDISKGKSVKINMDSVDVSVMGENVITLVGSYGMKPLDSQIGKPEGSQMDIWAATEEDWNQVIQEIGMNFMLNYMQLLY